MIRRLSSNCLLRPEDIGPSHDWMEVIGTFNPGVIATEEGVVLLVRVAERPKERKEKFTALPRWVPGEGMQVDWMPNDTVAFQDPRVVEIRATGMTRLTFISHIVVARSKDGRTIDSVDEARFVPEEASETFGVEDPRITGLDGRCYFTYVAVSPHGAATSLASTVDFRTFERHGVVFPPENKDVLLFPEQIEGDYVAFHRPNPATHFCPPEMWLARSGDLVHWGRHEPFHGGKTQWETGRIGGGAPPLKTADGWLAVYHGNQKPSQAHAVGVYSAGALLLAAENPQRIMRRCPEPILVPETDFEQEGFVPHVVFPTGIVDCGETLLVYYGAADTHTGMVEFSKKELLAALR